MPLPPDGGESAVYDSPSAFDPYDPPTPPPDSVQPTADRPVPLSDTAPDLGDTSGADGEPQEAPPEDDKDPLPKFDEKHREAFEGLLYLGRLQETFTLWGHRFVIRTLTTEQMADIALIVKPYMGTSVENAIYQTAVVAASVVTVDGQPLPGSINVDQSDELATVKFPYVKRNWIPAVREQIYNRCFALELTTRQVLRAMGEASG